MIESSMANRSHDEEEQWVLDDEKVRGYEGKKLLVKDVGVFLMHVSETNSAGERKPGYVQVVLSPVVN